MNKRVFVKVILLRWGDSEREAEVSEADLKISLFNNSAAGFADGKGGHKPRNVSGLKKPEQAKHGFSLRASRANLAASDTLIRAQKPHFPAPVK